MVNEHKRIYRGAEDAFFKNAGVSNRERSLVGKLGDAATVAKTQQLGETSEFQGHGRAPGRGASLVRRATTVSKAANPSGVQAGLDEVKLNQLDRDRKVGALKFGTGAAAASSGRNDRAIGALGRAAALNQEVRTAQKERDAGARADFAGNALGIAGSMGSDSKYSDQSGADNPIGDFFAKIGLTNGRRNASYEGRASNGDETGYETPERSAGTRAFDFLF